MAKILTIGFENMDKMAEVEGVLKALGIKYSVKEVEKAETVNAPASKVVDTKAKDVAKKDSKPKKNKDEDWFDREKYLELGDKFKATFVTNKGEKKVYAYARPSIYAVLRGELTMAKAKTQIAKAKKASDEKYSKKSA